MTTRWWVLRTCWRGTELGWPPGAQPSRAAAVMAAAPCPAPGRPAAAGPAMRRAAVQRRLVLLPRRVPGGQQAVHCKSFPAAPHATVMRRRCARAAKLPRSRCHGHLHCGRVPASQQRRVSSRWWQAPGRAGLRQDLRLVHLSPSPRRPSLLLAPVALQRLPPERRQTRGSPAQPPPGARIRGQATSSNWTSTTPDSSASCQPVTTPPSSGPFVHTSEGGNCLVMSTLSQHSGVKALRVRAAVQPLVPFGARHLATPIVVVL